MQTRQSMRWSCGVVALCAAFLWPVGAGAQTVEQLKQELEAHKKQTAELENRINQLEARQKLKERSLNEESSDADTSLWGIQAYVKQDLVNSDYVLAGAGWYDYGSLRGLEDEFGIGFGNTAASTSGDTAWLVGATLGKAKNPGSWQFGYDYRDVERDAVLAV